MSVQTISAAQAVGEFLQSPDDLMKIAAFRKKLEKEKASIDAKLKSGVKDQLDATKDGLRKLLGTRNSVQSIKDEMTAIDRMCRDPANVVPTFDQISRVSMVHRHFEQTEEMVNKLTSMAEKVELIEEMLEESRRDILGPARNLLPLHYHVNQLEAFRNETLHLAKKASPSSRDLLNRYFEPLNKVIEGFDEYILALAKNILALIRAGNSPVVVKLIKIAEVEGREDEKAIAIKLVKKAAKLDAASKFKSMQANARVIKHYRSKITKCITESIKEAFERAYERDPNPADFIEGLQWIYQDLIVIQDDVVHCFPPSYDISSLYYREYHKTLNATLKRLLDTNPEAGIFLQLHAWVKEYQKSMKELDVPSEHLEPALLGGKEQGLIEDYLQVIIKKLDEWTNNLMKTETRAFMERSEQPEIDSEELYGMQGAIDLFQMVNQQVNLGIESGQGAILARVVSESGRVMMSVQGQWTKIIDAELKKQVEKPAEQAPGLVEYIIALANDQIRSMEFAEALAGRLESLVSKKYQEEINKSLNDGIDGYLDVAKKCTQVVVELMFNDLKPVTKQFFTPTWYGGVMTQVIETIRDYMQDSQTYLNPALFDLLVVDLLQYFVVTYLTALGNASKLRMSTATDRIRDDIGEAFKYLTTLRPARELEDYFEAIEMALGMLEASSGMVFLSWWSFAKVHGPNLSFVEALMKARDDLDRSAVSEVMESIRRKAKEENLVETPENSIMRRVVIQGTFARLLQR